LKGTAADKTALDVADHRIDFGQVPKELLKDVREGRKIPLPAA
jgi:hypothetical protein